MSNGQLDAYRASLETVTIADLGAGLLEAVGPRRVREARCVN